MSDLDPTLFRTTGRAAKPVTAVAVRELDATDIAMLSEERGIKPQPLKKIAARHHSLARCLASGMTPGDAAVTCGLTASRVSILQDDPAFKELLNFYREDVDRAFRDMHERLAGLSLDAVEELSIRLEADMDSEDKSISIGQLIEISKLGADRTGFGPQSSNTQLNINVDLAARLEKARKRVQERRASDVIIDQ